VEKAVCVQVERAACVQVEKASKPRTYKTENHPIRDGFSAFATKWLT